MLVLEGWDTQGEGHGCAVDAMGRIHDTVRDHPSAFERRWKEVKRHVQGRLPYVTAGAFLALPPTVTQLVTRGDPEPTRSTGMPRRCTDPPATCPGTASPRACESSNTNVGGADAAPMALRRGPDHFGKNNVGQSC